MSIFISHESALEFWTSPVHCDSHAIRATNSRALPGRPCSSGKAEHLLETALLGMSRPLHICIKSGLGVPRTASLYAHRCKTELLPGQSFWQVERDLYVASPELCFLQASPSLSVIEQIKLGYEFCGSYTLDDTDLRGFRNRAPLTTARKLSSFANRAKSLPGRAQAARAAQYVLDNSASPMETAAVMMMFLPRNLGGYGLPSPKLNQEIRTARIDGFGAARRSRKGDFVWERHKLIVECDSKLAHGQSADIARDSKRRSELIREGFEVITLTYSEMSSIAHFNNFIQNVAHRIGYQMRPEYFVTTEARHALRKLVLARSTRTP